MKKLKLWGNDLLKATVSMFLEGEDVECIAEMEAVSLTAIYEEMNKL